MGVKKSLYSRYNFVFEVTYVVNDPRRRMTRGNQRDLAREKAAKAAKGKTKAASDQDANKGMTKEQRMQRDADRMREKQAAKAAAKEASGGASADKNKKWQVKSSSDHHFTE